MRNVVFIVTSASYARAREGIDLILGVSAFVENITVVFSGDGVRLLLAAGRKPEAHGERDFFKTMGMLELYDITDVKYCIDSPVCSEYQHFLPDIPALGINSNELDLLLRDTRHRIVI